MATIRLGLAQLNPVVGDLAGNAAMILSALEDGFAQGCDLVCVPELALVGYPPEDLLLKDGFVADAEAALRRVAAAAPPCLGVVGSVLGADSGLVDLAAPVDGRDIAQAGASVPGHALANAAVLVGAGRLLGAVAKRRLPNYAVFDEQRWFSSGIAAVETFLVAGASVGVLVCEDLWVDAGPAAELAAAGAGLIVVINASPYSRRRHEDRRALLSRRVEETGCVIAYVNIVGGQDELVFDGASCVIDATGSVLAAAPQFEPSLLVVDVDVPDAEGDPRGFAGVAETRHDRGAPIHGDVADPLDEVAEVYAALVLGTRDYLTKNGFASAVIGLSGGIDSSLVAVIAADALGADRVLGVSMPSRYSSEHSVSDADALAERLGISLATAPIEAAHVALSSIITGPLGAPVAGLTDENLQSRIRGVILMGISNATGAIVLTTGNKSEMATGYSTLYGDSAGGFAVIKDVVKTLVYDLCRYRNRLAIERGEPAPIPEDVLTKPPSAELRPDQRDDESLPPYELLDPVLEAYVEDDRSVSELIAEGHDPALVTRVAALVDAAEYKRRQMPPGVRITTKSFGKDRRMPITNRYGRQR